jgi:hypothetical protein
MKLYQGILVPKACIAADQRIAIMRSGTDALRTRFRVTLNRERLICEEVIQSAQAAYESRLINLLIQDQIWEGIHVAAVSVTHLDVYLGRGRAYIILTPEDIFSSLRPPIDCNVDTPVRIICDPERKTVTFRMCFEEGQVLAMRNEFAHIERDITERIMASQQQAELARRGYH